MRFIDRGEEMERLDRLVESGEAELVVIYGRRRIGKTRLLLEWSEKHGGLYTVADQSAPEIQRRYFAEAVAERLPGFAEVTYPDWRRLLTRLAREAGREGWRGPLILDELPYLVVASPELPSLLQRWLDHEAQEAKLVVALAGSSQRMMQGLVLASDAPLFGRAREIFEVRPIEAFHLSEVFPSASRIGLVEAFTAWGGVPRYWELAVKTGGSVEDQLENLVLDPLGSLHREPDRLLIEEIPPALETRPVLDAIGAGAHRVSEIAGRLGRPATSMWRPLDRLIGMGLVSREVPFGESEKKSRRSLYKIADPFTRLWFRVVAPHRGLLASSPRATRRQLLQRYWPDLAARAWEDLCRQRLPKLEAAASSEARSPWGSASRWWKGSAPEWDVVSESLDGENLLLGEVKWSSRPFSPETLTRHARELAAKPAPILGGRHRGLEPVRVLFVPEIAGARPELPGVHLLTAAELLGPGGGSAA
jgi:AAA+ ATPase superfamily predicted ATPase